MKKKKPAPKKKSRRSPRRDENQSAFDAVKRLIERTETK
jgi:hypothetical protein